MLTPTQNMNFAGRPHLSQVSGKCSASSEAELEQLAMVALSLIETNATKTMSRLTPNGNPIELAFIWPVADHRLTIDPCPSAIPSDRVQRCFQILNELPTDQHQARFSAIQQQAIQQITAWQTLHDLRYGAWIGLRYRKGGVCTKLYLEVPENADWQDWETRLFGPCPTLHKRNARPTMIGLDRQTGGLEVYYTCNRLFTQDINILCSRLSCQAAAQAVSKFTSDLTQRSARFELPSYDMGFSNALGRDGAPLAFTWYSTSAGLLGPDSRARAALARTGGTRDWDMALYSRLSDSCAVAGIARNVLVGIAIPQSGTPHFTATLSLSPRRLAEFLLQAEDT